MTKKTRQIIGANFDARARRDAHFGNLPTMDLDEQSVEVMEQDSEEHLESEEDESIVEEELEGFPEN